MKTALAPGMVIQDMCVHIAFLSDARRRRCCGLTLAQVPEQSSELTRTPEGRIRRRWPRTPKLVGGVNPPDIDIEQVRVAYFLYKGLLCQCLVCSRVIILLFLK